MLESLVASILNRILGSYVENFDPKQLQIGLLSGDVKLAGLKLKRGALDHLQLPLNIVNGHIGSLVLQIPYSNLKSKPVKVFIEDVFLIAKPDMDHEEEGQKRREQAAKIEKLQLWELSSERAMVRASSNSPAESEAEIQKQKNFTSSLVSKIIENVQVTIRNIHIRFEDLETGVALGATLGELSAISTNKDWEPAFIADVGSTTHKLATLDSLAFYIDPEVSTPFSTPTSKEEKAMLLEEFKALIFDSVGATDILRPINGQGFITLNKNPETELVPKIKADLKFEELSINMDREQYLDALRLTDRFQKFFNSLKYRRLRPKVAVKEDPMAWFRYAATTVLDGVKEKRRQWSWEHIQKHISDQKRYVELYKKWYRSGSSDQELTPQERAEFNSLQTDYSYEQLQFFRSLAKKQLVSERAEVRTKPQASQTWSEWLWGSKPSPEQQSQAAAQQIENEQGNNSVETAPPIEITDQDRQELLDVLDVPTFSEETTSQVLLEVEFSLRSAGIRLKLGQTALASAGFENVKTTFVNRPSSSSLEMSVARFEVSDLTRKNQFSDIIRVQDMHDEASDDPFLWFLFEHHPADKKADSNLFLKSRSVVIVHNARLLESVMEFFAAPADQGDTVDAILLAANKTVEGLREQTRLGLEYALENHKTMNLQLDIKAPTIVVPLDTNNADSAALVLDVGSLQVASDLVPQNVLSEVKSKQALKYSESDWKRLESLMYDRFTVKLCDTQILLGERMSDISNSIKRNSSNLHFLDKATLKFLLEQSIVPNNHNLTRTRISISLPALRATLADVQYMLFMKIITAATPTSKVELDDDSPRESIPQHDSRQSPEAEGNPENEQKDGDAKLPLESSTKVKPQRLFEFVFLVNEVQFLLVRGWHGKPLVDLCLHEVKFSNWSNRGLPDESLGAELTVGDLLITDHVDTSGPQELRKVAESAGHANEASSKSTLFQVKFHKAVSGDMDVEVNLAAIRFHLDPKTVLSIYDYVMSTFTSPPESRASTPPVSAGVQSNAINSSNPEDDASVNRSVGRVEDSSEPSRIKVRLSMQGVSATIVENHDIIAIMSMERAELHVDMKESMKVKFDLATVSLVDKERNAILSIEGENNLVDFRFETEPILANGSQPPSLVYLHMGRVKLQIIEEPLTRLASFLSTFTAMKAVYDQARMMTFNQTIQVEPGMFKFDIVISTPIIVWPREADWIRLNLGEVYVANDFEGTINNVEAGIRNVQITSQIGGSEQPIVPKTDFTVKLLHTPDSDDLTLPLMSLKTALTPIHVQSSEFQYGLILEFMNSLSKISAGAASASIGMDEVGDLRRKLAKEKHIEETQTSYWWGENFSVALGGDTKPGETAAKRPKFRFDFDAPLLDITLDYEAKPLSRMSIEKFSVEVDIDKNSSLEANFYLRSIGVDDLSNGSHNKFTQIVPPIKNDGQQLMGRFIKRADQPYSLECSVDSPQVILALGYLSSLKKFLEHGAPSANAAEDEEGDDESELESSGSFDESYRGRSRDGSIASSVPSARSSREEQAEVPDSTAVRDKPPAPHICINITDLYLTVLEDESNENSEALVFKIEQVILNSGETSSFTLSKIGIFLTRMQSFEKSRLRVLDDFNITTSIDNSESTNNFLLTNIQANIDPLVVRISLREIQLILGILQKASEISPLGNNTSGPKKQKQVASPRKATNFFADDYRTADEARKPSNTLTVPDKNSRRASADMSRRNSSETGLVEVTRVLAEQLIAQFDGMRVVLIDPLHQLPMIDFCVKPFNLIAKNWSDSIVVNARAELYANVHSFTKSAWEPLIDTMEIGFTATTDTVEIFSSTVADLEFSLETIELGHDIRSYFDDPDSNHFSRADSDEGLPYRIINNTGLPITVWADSQKGKSRRRKIADSEEIGWSFHDWRELRENLNSTDQDNTVGVEFHAEGFGMLRSVLVNRVGEYLYPVENDGKTTRILFEISVENHLKYIRIRSTELIKNHTETDLEMLVIEQDQRKIMELPAKSNVALPLSLIDSHLAIRRKGDSQWPNRSLYWKDLFEEDKLTLKCSDDFYLSVIAENSDKPLSQHFPYLTINLTAPFRIINNLTSDVRLKLYSREMRRETNEDVAKTGRILVHNYSSDALLLLRVDVPGYACNKFAVINTGSRYHTEFHVEDTVEISQDHQKLQLVLKYIDLPGGEGRAIVVYSPYVILNSCESELILSGRRSRINCEPGASKLWSFQHLNSQNPSQRATIATADSQPSAPVSLDASGSAAEIALVSKDRQRDLYLGVTVIQGTGRYVDTKIVTISPRFILCNSTDRPLCFREPGGKQEMQAAPGDRTPVGYMWSMAEKEMCLRFGDSNGAEWSSSFSMMNVGTSYLRLSAHGEATVLLKVEVILEGASLFVHFFKTSAWPYSVRNFTDMEFVFYQSDPLIDEDGAEMDGHSDKQFTPVTYRLPPKSAMPYSWDFPAAKVKQLVISPAAQPPQRPQRPPALPSRPSTSSEFQYSDNEEAPDSRRSSIAQSSFVQSSMASFVGSEITSRSETPSKPPRGKYGHRVRKRYVRLAEIGELPPANFGGDTVVDISVIADGPQQALVIAPHSPEASNYDLRTNTVKQDVLAETEALENKTGRAFKLDLKGIGISFITHNAQELLYVTLRNVKAEYHMSEAFETVSMQVQWIQVDNTLPGSNDFPVIIYPTVLPKAAEELAAHPCFSASITRVPDDSYGLTYIKHATLLLQEMTIEADEDFLLALVGMVISLVTRKAPDNPQHEYYQPLIDDNSALCDDIIQIPEPSTDSKAGNIYFEQLHLQPIQLNLSFMRTGALSTTSIFKDNNVAGSLAFLIDALTLTIGNINDAPVKFNALLVDNVRTEATTLSNMIRVHYQQEFLYQIHKIVGSADIIGNPVGLFNNISSGVIDLFYEPYLGYTLNDRPQEFGIGLAKGGLSFMKKSVFGLSDSVSKVTGALSKGIAVMTLDPRYQNRQRGRRTRNRPKHAVSGFKYGVESFYESLSSGFMGLAEAPMQGAVTSGGAGFFKGLGVGLVGLPTKTTIGLLDFASNLTEGIRNTTTVFDAHEIARVRLPRVVSHDGIIKPYNVRESVGQMVLHTVKDNRYAKDRYLAHSNITRNKVVVVSMERVLVASINDMSLEWSLTYDQVESIALEDTGIVIKLLGGAHGPFIPLSEEYARTQIYKSIGRGVDEHNKLKITLG